MQKENGFSQVWVLVILGVLTVIFIVGIFVLPKKKITIQPVNSQASTSSQSGMSDMKVTDLAPNLSASQKTTIVVQHSDSSFEKFLLPSETVRGYVASLPNGDKVITQTPLK